MTIYEQQIHKQYVHLKKRNPDGILFFRLGDFYEAFNDDAETIADELDLTLTSRPSANGQRVPMAGFPAYVAEGYFNQLVESGYKIVIGEENDYL